MNQQSSNTATTTNLIGDEFNGTSKWCGGELATDGCIYSIPKGYQPQSILKIDPAAQSTSLIPFKGDKSDNHGGVSNSIRSLWYGSILGPDGCIYGIPFESSRILKFEPMYQKVSFVGEKLGIGGFKYISASVGHDGMIYFIPFNAKNILRFDPLSESTSFVGKMDFRHFPGHWRGAVVGPNNGCIYCIPYDAKHVLKFNPDDQSIKLIGRKMNGSLKWYGGVLGMDGNIYGIPHCHSRILKIDPLNDTTSFVGHDYDYMYSKCKWAGGVLGSDNSIYMIPCDTKDVLRFDPLTAISKMILCNNNDTTKYVGGALANDGFIYCIPSHAKHVLRVRSWNGWLYLRLRLLIEMRRANILQMLEEDLLTVQYHITNSNDDIFRYVNDFL